MYNCSRDKTTLLRTIGVYDSERLSWLGGMDHNPFEYGGVQLLHDLIANEHPKTTGERYLDTLQMSKPFKYGLAAMNGSIYYKTLNSYDEHDIIMHCYGVLKHHIRDKVFLEKEADGPMVMGGMTLKGLNLLLDGRKNSNDWKHVMESCDPNCKFIEDCIFYKRDNKFASYFCYLAATRNIKQGETLRVAHKHLRGFNLANEECGCDKRSKVYDVNGNPICSFGSCVDLGKNFGDVWQLYLHCLNNHSEKEMIEKLEKEIAYIKSFRYSCPVVSCMKWLKNAEEWRNHVTDSHPKFEGLLPTCSTCGKQFVGKRSLRKHVKKGLCDEGN